MMSEYKHIGGERKKEKILKDLGCISMYILLMMQKDVLVSVLRMNQSRGL